MEEDLKYSGPKILPDLRLRFIRSPPVSGPIMTFCQEHDDTTKPNLAIYSDGLYCFACGFRIQNTKKASEYLDQFDITLDTKNYYRSERKEKSENLNAAVADLYCDFLFKNRSKTLEYLRSRTLADQTIQKFKLGSNGLYITIPVFQSKQGNRVLHSIRYRRDDDYEDSKSSKYFGQSGRNESILYPGYQSSCDLRPYRIVTEGELDAIRLWQDDIPAITATNGVNNIPKILDFLDDSNITTLYIATDIDSAGMEAYRRVQIIDQNRFKIVPVCWQRELGKDPTEVAQNNEEEFKRIFWKYRQ